jgi:hypothetical protein
MSQFGISYAGSSLSVVVMILQMVGERPWNEARDEFETDFTRK